MNIQSSENVKWWYASKNKLVILIGIIRGLDGADFGSVDLSVGDEIIMIGQIKNIKTNANYMFAFLL